MTELNIAQNTPILVAIDIVKARHEVLIAIPSKKRRRRVTALNQLDAFKRLITSLASYGLPVEVAFEATGNYHPAISYHLATAGFEVKLVSSVSLARTREAPPKWLGLFTGSSKTVNHIAPFLRGDRQQ